MRFSKLARGIFYLLLAIAPLGTRYIFEMGNIGGVDVEPGTFSVFGTQILALAFVCAALFAVRGGILSRTHQLALGGAAMVFSVASLSAAFSGDLRSLVLLNWLFLGVGLAVACLKIQPSLTRSLAALALGGVLQSLFALWQFASQSVVANKWLGVAAHLSEASGTFVVETSAGRWLRAYGTLPHPNMLGAYLAVAVLASAVLALSVRDKWRLPAGLLIIVNLLGLSLSLSRGALLGLAVGLAVFVSFSFLDMPADSRRWREVMAAVGIVFVVLAQSFLLLRDPAIARVLARGRLERISVESRFSQLDDARLLLNDNWLLGVGPGLMPFAVAERDPNREPWDYAYVHDVPLLILVEVGALGLLAWFTLVASVVTVVGRAASRRFSFTQAGLVSALVSLIVMGLFDHFLWSAWFGQLLFWAIVGLTITVDAKVKTSA